MIVETNRLMHYSLRAVVHKGVEGGMGEGRGGIYPPGFGNILGHCWLSH